MTVFCCCNLLYRFCFISLYAYSVERVYKIKGCRYRRGFNVAREGPVFQTQHKTMFLYNSHRNWAH